jgi:hypothetical protein
LTIGDQQKFAAASTMRTASEAQPQPLSNDFAHLRKRKAARRTPWRLVRHVAERQRVS